MRASRIAFAAVELDALMRALAPSDDRSAEPVEISDLAYDADRVVPGALFFCVPARAPTGTSSPWRPVAAGPPRSSSSVPLDVDVPQLVVEDARVAMAVAADVFFGEPTRAPRGGRA